LAGNERELVHGKPDDDSLRRGDAADARRQAGGRLVSGAAAGSRDESAELHGEQRLAEGEEKSKGSLSNGKLADFVVIDRDLFAIPPAQLKDAKVLMTVVGGRIVHALAPFKP
jgi:predicted amidohydrolase YtcJ